MAPYSDKLIKALTLPLRGISEAARIAARSARRLSRRLYHERLRDLQLYLSKLGELAKSDRSLSGERAEELALMMRQVKAEIAKLEKQLEKE